MVLPAGSYRDNSERDEHATANQKASRWGDYERAEARTETLKPRDIIHESYYSYQDRYSADCNEK